MNIENALCDILHFADLIDRVDGWIAWIRNVRRGGTVEIRVERISNLSGGQCGALLKRYHVPIAGRLVSGKFYHFQVRRQQAAWAEYILRRAGAPVATQIDRRNIRWAARHAGPPPAWGAKQTNQPTTKRTTRMAA